MICGCMSTAGVEKIRLVNGIINWKYYIDILKESVLRSAKSLSIKTISYSTGTTIPNHGLQGIGSFIIVQK